MINFELDMFMCGKNILDIYIPVEFCNDGDDSDDGIGKGSSSQKDKYLSRDTRKEYIHEFERNGWDSDRMIET